VHDFDAAQIQPGWHAWISYAVDKPPTQDQLLIQHRGWERPGAIVNYTMTRGAYKPYNTVKPKIASWIPKAIERAA
jgi:NADH:ubiquinone oxidoreductase subunit